MFTEATTNLVDQIDKAFDRSAALDAHKIDFTAKAGDFYWTNEGQLKPPDLPSWGSWPMELPGMQITGHAFGQWRAKMGRMLSSDVGTLAKGDWEAMRENYPTQFSHIANSLHTLYGEDARREELLVRTDSFTDTENEGVSHVRAVLSKRYQIVSNTAMLEALRSVMVEDEDALSGGRIIRPELDADAMRFRIVVKETNIRERSIVGDRMTPYGIGIAVSNDEIGRGSVRVAALIQRNPCSNSIIIDNGNALVLRHTQSAVAILAQVKMKLIEVLPMAAQALERVYEASVAELPSLGNIVSNLTAEYGWSDEIKDTINQGTEGMRSQLGLVNGVTFAAHSLVENLDDRYQMEALGGRLLMQRPDQIEHRYGQRVLN